MKRLEGKLAAPSTKENNVIDASHLDASYINAVIAHRKDGGHTNGAWISENQQKSMASPLPKPPNRRQSTQPKDLATMENNETVKYMFLRKNSAKMRMPLQIPDGLKCLISGKLMVDPVMDPEGNTYERASIEAWLAWNPISPITRTPLTKERLKPAINLKEDFDQLKERIESICTTTGNKGKPIQQVQASLNYGYALEENLANRAKNSMTSQRPVTSSPSWGRVRHNRLQDKSPFTRRHEVFNDKGSTCALRDRPSTAREMSEHLNHCLRTSSPDHIRQQSALQCVTQGLDVEQLEEVSKRIAIAQLHQLSQTLHSKFPRQVKADGLALTSPPMPSFNSPARTRAPVSKVEVLGSTGKPPAISADQYNTTSFLPHPPLISKRSMSASRAGGFQQNNPQNPAAQIEFNEFIVPRKIAILGQSNTNVADQARPNTGIPANRRSAGAEHIKVKTISRCHRPLTAEHKADSALVAKSTHRPQTSLQSHRPKTADKIVCSALEPAHRFVPIIYPSERLNTSAKDYSKEPILQESKRVSEQKTCQDLSEQKSTQSPGPLNLNNLVVDWTDWTVPTEISARRGKIRPKTSHFSLNSPRQQEGALRSHSSSLASLQGNIGTNRLPNSSCRDLDHEPHQNTSQTSLLSTEKVQEVDSLEIKDGFCKATDETRSSTRSAEKLWSDIVKETENIQPDIFSDNASGSACVNCPPFNAGHHYEQLQLIMECPGQTNSHELRNTAGSEKQNLVHPLTVCDWIGTKNYHDYMQPVKDLVSTSSEHDLNIEQGARVRKLAHQNTLVGGTITCAASDITRTGSDISSKVANMTRTSGAINRTGSDIESSQAKLSVVAERAKREKEVKSQQIKVLTDMNKSIFQCFHQCKLGDRDAPTSKGGLGELIQAMESYDNDKVPQVIKFMDKDVKEFFKTQMKHENQAILLEGRAHTAATLEMSKCYLSAFYVDSADRIVDDNALATHRWDGMTRHEIMKHAEFLSELDYVKLKAYDLISRHERETREIDMMKSTRRMSRRETFKKVKPPQPTTSVASNEGYIRIVVQEADNLPTISASKKSTDTHVRCELRTENDEYLSGSKHFVADTGIVWDSFSPVWNTELVFQVPNGCRNISVFFNLLDVDLENYGRQQSDSLVGFVEIPIFTDGYQTIVAEEETTQWYELLDNEKERIRSNNGQAMGRFSVLKLMTKFSRRNRISKSTLVHIIQNAYRCHLSRVKFQFQKQHMDGLRNRQTMNPEIVLKLRQEHDWDHYLSICIKENVLPSSKFKKQFQKPESLVLTNSKLSINQVRAISRFLTEVYQHGHEISYAGRLRSLEISYAGINSAGMVALAHALNAGCAALNCLILDGNHITKETNDVSQANNPVTNRLGSGLAGCKALSEVIQKTNKLHRLSLRGCKLGDHGLAEIARALQDNRTVEILDLSDTNEEKNPAAMQHAATELGKMLAENNELVEFQCHSVGFHAHSALALLGAGKFSNIGLRCNRNLRVVNLSRNNLCRNILANQALRDFLHSAFCLVENLDLSYNHMDQNGALVFSDGLVGNKSLRKVIMDGNELGLVGCRTLLSYRGRKAVLAKSTMGLTEKADSSKPRSKMEIRQIFEHFDTDHSGALCVDEMKAFLKTLNNKNLGDAQTVIAKIDYDESGTIEFDEFYDWYMDNLGIEDDGEQSLEISLEHCGGYSNVKGFDPSDPNGSYRLDMSLPTSQTTLLCMIQMIFSGKAEFVEGTMKRIEDGEDDSTETPYMLHISDDPSNWDIPKDGTLVFDFGILRPAASVDDCVGSFIIKKILECFSDLNSTRQERDEILETCSGDDAFFNYKQILHLLEALTMAAAPTVAAHQDGNECSLPSFMERKMTSQEERNLKDRQSTLEEERVNLVTRLFLRMVDKQNNMKVLGLLNQEERIKAEEILGIAAFTFSLSNPTGFYHLDLSKRPEREVMMRLIELRNSQRTDMTNWKKHLNRASSGREDIEIIFRNLKFNDMPYVYSSSWRVPEKGRVEVDFVDIRKPKADSKPIDGLGFHKMMASLKQFSKRPSDLVNEIRNVANVEYFNCLQLWQLLCIFNKQKPDESRCRVEVAIACCARVVDWRAIRRVYIMELLPTELSHVEYRLGKANLYFDEVSSAVGYWEFDMSDKEDRWILLELVYLASIEPGYNVIQAKLDVTAPPGSLADHNYRFDGVDFKIPASWISEVPTSGVVKMFYARQAAINAKYIKYGSWDGRSAALLKPHSSCFPPDFRVPAIPDNYDEQRDTISTIWVYIEKIRIIKYALLNVSTSAKKMFSMLDTSGDGDLSRKELALGLFRLGVWLTPVESEMMLHVVDVDGSGEVDMEEFECFWRNAPPFRSGDLEQQEYWVPRRCSEKLYEEMIYFYDIRMAYAETSEKKATCD